MYEEFHRLGGNRAARLAGQDNLEDVAARRPAYRESSARLRLQRRDARQVAQDVVDDFAGGARGVANPAVRNSSTELIS